jgi:hypothetical protein
MPATSKAQLRAMYAAKEGKSTLGIPKSVGEDFTSATKSTKGLPEKKGDAVHSYLDAVVRGDSVAMAKHSKKMRT